MALCLCSMSTVNAAGPSSDDAAFMAENDAAMSKMMKNMDVTPSGNVDEDFVAMMQPHHQAAIEMAQSELRYGHNEKLRQIAQQIIAQQQQEIVAMREALSASMPASTPAADQPEPARPEVSHKNPKMDGPPGS
ncbi:MAG: DUF305 domain-containing protein [Paraburkholderia sp.]